MMTAYRKLIILLVDLLIIFAANYISLGNEEILNNIYVVVSALGEVHDQYDDQFALPNTKICKLIFNKKNFAAKFITIKEIEALQTQSIEIYYDYNLMLVSTSIDEIWSAYLNVYFIDLNRLWEERKPYKQHDVYEILYPATISGKDQLISYTYGKIPVVKSIDPDTLKETSLKLDNIPFSRKRTKFIITADGKLKYDEFGMENYYYQYILPQQIYKDQQKQKITLIEETKKYVVLQMFPENNIVIYDKSKKVWSRYLTASDGADCIVINDIIVGRCFKKASEPHTPGKYTGEWVLINAKNKSTLNIKFSIDETIIFATENFILTTIGNKFMYYPLTVNKVLLNKKKVIYEDRQEDIGTRNEIVPFIIYAFFGPKDIPDNLKINCQ
ncbi:MAG: hypothetical protein K6U03_02590 [Firmicutes bacterium]|nr:hypothetical protein [Bacillota bacterium]